ncbi:iron chelate uptake ABC transporter family permease subunit [Enterococcus saccharolyticus]|uniref:iron chelate uptake ABC transporter family permease subunit n=1 Tax=Enterococcus saccharolyticus TaxID=41997 RepID=UPI00039AB119|nr:iron chelate uptake ABC transporter family permease subunit [Enterococcus saccharolyticus]
MAILIGSTFLAAVDILARTMIENNELPIGIFTAIVGAPFFAFIIIRKNYQFKE